MLWRVAVKEELWERLCKQRWRACPATVEEVEHWGQSRTTRRSRKTWRRLYFAHCSVRTSPFGLYVCFDPPRRGDLLCFVHAPLLPPPPKSNGGAPQPRNAASTRLDRLRYSSEDVWCVSFQGLRQEALFDDKTGRFLPAVAKPLLNLARRLCTGVLNIGAGLYEYVATLYLA